jgi:hypothetical protein
LIKTAVHAEDLDEAPGVLRGLGRVQRNEPQRSALRDDLLDQRASDRRRREVERGESAGRLAPDRDGVGIAAEAGDVALHPGEHRALVLDAEVVRPELRQIEVAERTDAVVGCDDDDPARRGQVPATGRPKQAGNLGLPPNLRLTL